MIDTNDLRKAARAVFLATEEDIAHDLSGKLNKAAREIDDLRYKADRSTIALKLCYMKHVADSDRIGWEELSGELCDTLCEIMGDDEFQKWLETF